MRLTDSMAMSTKRGLSTASKPSSASWSYAMRCATSCRASALLRAPTRTFISTSMILRAVTVTSYSVMAAPQTGVGGPDELVELDPLLVAVAAGDGQPDLAVAA